MSIRAPGRRALALALPFLALLPARGGDTPPKEPVERTVSVERAGQVGGVAMTWSATAGTLVLREDGQKAKASVFYTAYLQQGVSDPATRPVTFAFNGGPGSASVWLHLGALGPQRVQLDAEGLPGRPPGGLEPNPDAWLDLSDLVFVDPVTTGFSRAAEGEEPRQFHGVEEDVAWMGEFIRLWVTRYGRWSSPKFLVGESYGTTRVAALAHHLAERQGMQVNGVVLISPVLEFGTIRFDAGNEDPYWLFLPTYAAVAWHHGRLAPELQQEPLERLSARVEAWARSTYLPALAAGDRLSAEERGEVARQLAAFSGLSPEFVRRSHLRVDMGSFAKELLRDKGLIVGRYDGRYVGRDAEEASDSPRSDPSYSAVHGIFTAGINDLLRRDLGWESDVPYEVLTGRVHPWNYPVQNRYLNVAERLRDAMLRNPWLHVLTCEGFFDLATPWAAIEHTLARMELPPELRGNLHRATYRAGHMMYLRASERTKLKQDAARFYQAALGR